VQVDGDITRAALLELESGVEITIEGKPYKTKNCKTVLFDAEPNTPPRYPPIRFRKDVPAPWIKMILTEGKNRQVRKMTAKVGYPTLRLIRYRIEGLILDNMRPGQIISLPKNTLYKKLFSQQG
jgi:23S rRNA pseudouridine2457 synthase